MERIKLQNNARYDSEIQTMLHLPGRRYNVSKPTNKKKVDTMTHTSMLLCPYWEPENHHTRHNLITIQQESEFWVSCLDCHSSGPTGNSEADAEIKWNRRCQDLAKEFIDKKDMSANKYGGCF